MEIIDNRAVLLKVRNPDRITTVIPKSKVIQTSATHSDVLVNWGLEEAIVLKNLRIPIPSPINATYKWPGLFKPFDHQRETSSFLTLHRRAFCSMNKAHGKNGDVQ